MNTEAFDEGRIAKREARIAELEAERDKWHGDAVTQMKHKIRLEDEAVHLAARIAELEAELSRQEAYAGADHIVALEDEVTRLIDENQRLHKLADEAVTDARYWKRQATRNAE